MHPRGHIQIHGAAGAPAADDEVLLTAQQVCARLGGISAMTLWRWLGSEDLQFPQPTMRINNRRYWSAGSIRSWLADRQNPIAA